MRLGIGNQTGECGYKCHAVVAVINDDWIGLDWLGLIG